MRPLLAVATFGIVALLGCAPVSQRLGDAPSKPGNAALVQQVTDTERAFARTMASRDLKAFLSFLSAETVFFSGGKVRRGPQEVGEYWKRFYEGAEPPFSWEPKEVVVLESGTLALSSGPVHDPQGKLIGTFTSIWRLEAPGTWRILFDKGNPVCDEKP